MVAKSRIPKNPGQVVLCPAGPPRLAPRDECPNRLHDHPLPMNYNAAHEEAARRLRNRWVSRKCSECGLYGWESPG